MAPAISRSRKDARLSVSSAQIDACIVDRHPRTWSRRVGEPMFPAKPPRFVRLLKCLPLRNALGLQQARSLGERCDAKLAYRGGRLGESKALGGAPPRSFKQRRAAREGERQEKAGVSSQQRQARSHGLGRQCRTAKQARFSTGTLTTT